MKIQIDLTYEQIQSLLLNELKDAYEMNRVPFRNEGHDSNVFDSDSELLYCIERVIEYYSSPEEFALWQSSLIANTDSP